MIYNRIVDIVNHRNLEQKKVTQALVEEGQGGQLDSSLYFHTVH